MHKLCNQQPRLVVHPTRLTPLCVTRRPTLYACFELRRSCNISPQTCVGTLGADWQANTSPESQKYVPSFDLSNAGICCVNNVDNHIRDSTARLAVAWRPAIDRKRRLGQATCEQPSTGDAKSLKLCLHHINPIFILLFYLPSDNADVSNKTFTQRVLPS